MCPLPIVVLQPGVEINLKRLDGLIELLSECHLVELLQVLLEQVLACTVAATPVAQQEEGGGVGAGRVELAGEFAVVVHTPAFWKAWRPRIAESLPIGTASNT